MVEDILDDRPGSTAGQETPRSPAVPESQAVDMLERVTDPFFALDADWHYTYVSPRFEAHTGMRREDLIGKVIWDLFPALSGTLQERELRRAMAEQTAVRFEARTIHGDWTWVEVYAYPSSAGLTAWYSDISDRVLARQTEKNIAEDALRDSEEQFRHMADQAPVLLWISGTDMLRTWFNKPWLDFTGRTMEQEYGDGWAEGVHPDDYRRCLDIYTTSFAARRGFTLEYRLCRHDREYRWMLDSGMPLRDRGGEFTGYIGSCVDIHYRIMAEEEKLRLLERERAARSQAEHAGQMKDEFLATLSHELRTPLNAILGWSQLLRSEGLEPEALEQGLETIERNARIQTQIIEDLLDMSRITSGKIRLDVRRVDLHPVMEAALETIRPAADARGIRLQKVLDPFTDPVMGDASRLQQIIWNLLSNAIKFTPRGGKVQVVLKKVNSYIEITVGDTGQGISPAFMPHVFERFRQEDSSTTRAHGGLGLGLSIVKNLVEMHGGTVTVVSPGTGLGATFTVILPLAVVHSDEDGDRQHPKVETGAPIEYELPSLKGISVLVVDDEPDARDLVRRVLESAGAEVFTAASVDEALRLVRETRPAVLVSDIGMPDRDGYDLIREIRSLPESEGGRIPAVALTALARSEDRRRVLLTGFQMHVAKPAEPFELVAVVANVVGRMGNN
ncbi:MAG: rpfC [Chlorobi bacterium]|nr:rpfC [Chlorobiota bacterium]